MLDGLKKKPNHLRSDVGETVEEKAETAVDEAESDTDAEAEPAPTDTGNAIAEPEVSRSAVADPDIDAVGDMDVGSEADTIDAAGAPADVGPSPAAVETDTGSESGSAMAPEPNSEIDTGADASDEPSGEPTVDEVEPRESFASDTAETVLIEEDEDNSSGSGRLHHATAFTTGEVVIEEEDLEDPLWELEVALLQSDVETQIVEEIPETVHEKFIGGTRKQIEGAGQLVLEALHDALYEVIGVEQFDSDQRIAEADKPVTFIFTGTSGVGKTTIIAKLAKYFEKQGYSAMFANDDTYRADTSEQIREHAEAFDKKLITHEQGGGPAAVICDGVEYAEAHDTDIALGDTTGRLHASSDLMAQLGKINRVVGPDLTLLVDEAVIGRDAVEHVQQFNDAAAVDGVILTKADADSNGGVAVFIAYVMDKPILFFGAGQDYDHTKKFDLEQMVEHLFGEDE